MDLKFSEMMAMQNALYTLHEGEWPAMAPERGRDFILYMIEEIGEAIAVLKKKGDQAVMLDPNVRAAFLEEMADVLMYYNDALLRYHVSPEEISQAYMRKHTRNINRHYADEYKEKYHG